MGPPHGVLPGSVAIDLLLAVTDHVAVQLGPVLAWPNGLQLSLSMIARDMGASLDPRGHGHGRPPAELEEEWPPRAVFRLGVQYPDGGRAETYSFNGRPGPNADGIWLSPGGGGGGGGKYRCEYWLSPLPPEGTMTFACRWPLWGIDEAHADLDTAPLREAAARARAIWPDQLT